MGLCKSKQKARVAAETPSQRQSKTGAGTKAMHKKYVIDFTGRGTLGSGAYSTVYRCRLVDDEGAEERAVKVIKLAQMAGDELAALKVEVEILRETGHPNILHLYDYFEDDLRQCDEPRAYIVTELLQGGELFDRIVERTYYSEFEARKVIQILLDVMTHLHSKNIAHRDLKPENLLLKSEKDDHSLNVADFGFAAYSNGRSLTTQCGTPNYVAPEIIRNDKYGCEVDMWSVGVLTFVLLGGYPPFHNDNQKELFRRIKHADYSFDPQYWDVVSDDAKDFIRKLLVPNPSDRLNARQAMRHPWLVKGEHDLVNHSLEGALSNLKGFNAKRKFKAAAKMIITARRLSRISAANIEELARKQQLQKAASSPPAADDPTKPKPPASSSSAGDKNTTTISAAAAAQGGATPAGGGAAGSPTEATQGGAPPVSSSSSAAGSPTEGDPTKNCNNTAPQVAA